MQTVIKSLPWHDEASGIENLESTATARTPILVGIIIVAAAFCLGTAFGVVLTTLIFKH